MAILNLELGERSYPIYIDTGLISKTDLLSSHIRAKRVCIVTNDIVAPLYLDSLKAKLTDFQVDEVIKLGSKTEVTSQKQFRRRLLGFGS